ncbi:dihydrodipicolinate synthase family protein [Rhodobacter sp. 24-YEA-8]|uniref:dihydrodipicolinate synthase family protein n=1 Tax=Rhodobacter sp. 24-YEA-8 TaxID=1884310 RepID=UPI00089666DC|nr:dihydrodipicolinate synthase family protein [Rhodobacter sp. 24-YEA-8]SED50999.1 4-hydroxy-tetrahydrodipicolinate synthase/2-keto-3-deoxy-L-arabinonate dehydratase [Rhodobacter sp. 24-YEA-8]
MTQSTAPRYSGIFPVVPTIFAEDGSIDLPGQLRAVDFMIDSGVDGLSILANYSEQFLLSDDERAILTRSILEHAGGRVPVIVTTSHYSTRICIERSMAAEAMGAAMVMVLPPYHGATLRVAEPLIYEYFARLSDAINIPIMYQDAPISGTSLSAASLANMAREIEQLSYFKIEVPGTAAKLRELIRLGGDAVEGPWDGEEAITLMPDLDAGATGSMTGGAYADGLRPIIVAHREGRRDEALDGYRNWLPLINYENRQSGLLACKTLMEEGGVIKCAAPRHPFAPMTPETRAGLLDLARRLDPLVLHWGR